MTGNIRRPPLTAVSRKVTSRLPSASQGLPPFAASSKFSERPIDHTATTISRSLSHSTINMNSSIATGTPPPSKSSAQLSRLPSFDAEVPPSPDDKFIKAAESSSLPTVRDSLARDPFVSISRAIHSARLRAGAGLRTMAVHRNNSMNSKAAKYRACLLTIRKFWRPLTVLIFLTTTLIYMFSSRTSTPSRSDKPSASSSWSYLLQPFSKSRRPSAVNSESSLEVMLKHRPAAYRSPTFGTGPWLVAVVADQDRESCQRRDESTGQLRTTPCMGANVWVSYFKRGVLSLPLMRKSTSTSEMANITWLDETILEDGRNVYDGFPVSGSRGMELSELEWFNGRLLAPDDHTGLLMEISSPYGRLDEMGRKLLPGMPSSMPPGVRRKVLLLDGDGGEKSETFKGEWMTIKDGNLLIGGHGRPYTAAGNGSKIMSIGPKWVKAIQQGLNVSHLNWSEKYDAVARAADAEWPGYLMHEAVLWSNDRKEWVFLPRRRSTEAFDAEKNQRMGWNVVILANEEMTSFRTVKIDGLKDGSGSRGFSSAKFVPGSKDGLVAALRTVELEWKVGDAWSRKMETHFSVFDLNSGRIVMEETKIGDKKYEGMVFL